MIPFPGGPYFGKSSSILTSVSIFDAARVVVKPIQRPTKMTLIHKSSYRAATVLPDSGVFVSVSQR